MGIIILFNGNLFAQRALINTSFELPTIALGGNSLINDTKVPGWTTTDSKSEIEIWSSGFLGVPAQTGNQFVELNANSAGTLSQNICVLAGETITWSCWHRARIGTDVMAVFIDGTLQKTCTATTTAWVYNTSTWTNTGASRIVTFAFQAISSGSGNIGVGNFLDNIEIVGINATVSFSSSLYSSVEQLVTDSPVLLINGIITNPTSVTLNITGGTASIGSDYNLSASIINIPAGTYDGTIASGIPIPLTIIDDAVIEPDETIDIAIISTSGDIMVSISGCNVSEVNLVYTIFDDDCEKPNLGSDTLYCEGAAISRTLVGPLGNELYQWSTGETTKDLIVTSPGIYILKTGKNVLDRCSYSDTVVISQPLNPVVTVPADFDICHNNTTIAGILSSVGTGTVTYNWINNQTSIGLPASGSGNIPAFTAINNSNISETATISVTPTANGCIGLTKSYTITVNPIPNVLPPVNQTLCNKSSTTLGGFVGAVAGTSFSWTNDQTSIGLAASGSGDIAAFTAINTGMNPVIATISVTPSANTCIGIPKTFTYTINPTPDVVTPPNQTLCNTSTTTLASFSSSVAGTSFSWSNDQTSIGLAVSGSGDIAAFTAINTGMNPVIATISVIPTANTCIGVSKTFTYTINPTPPLPVITNPSPICQFATVPILATFVTGQNQLWYTNSSGGTGSPIPAIASNLTVGTFDHWISQTINGCESQRGKLSYIVKQIPNAPIVTPIYHICQNTTAPLIIANAGGNTLNWYNVGVGGTSSNLTPVILTNNIGQTNYWVSASASGCESFRSKIEINILANPEVNAVVPSMICNGETIDVTLNFIGMSPFTLNYTNAGISSQINAKTSNYIFQLTPNTDGNITFTKLTDSICVTIYNNFINNYIVNQLPKLTLVGNDTICDKQLVRIEMSSDISQANFKWKVAPLNTAVRTLTNFSSDNEINQNLQNLLGSPQNISYEVTAYNGSCKGETKTKIVTVLPSYSPVLPDTIPTVCKGSLINLNAGAAPFGYTLKWYKNDTLLLNDTTHILNINLAEDQYFKIVATNYCNASEEAYTYATIFAPQHLTDLVTKDSCAKFTSTFQLNTGPLIDNTKWYIDKQKNADLVDNKTTTILHNFNMVGVYPIKVEGYFGSCLLADTVFSFKTYDCSIVIKNTFTPNNDQANDYWYIEGIEKYPTASIVIFNRWGVIVKSIASHIPNDVWDGLNEEKHEVEAGTYYYILTLDEGIIPIKGYINLLR